MSHLANRCEPHLPLRGTEAPAEILILAKQKNRFVEPFNVVKRLNSAEDKCADETLRSMRGKVIRERPRQLKSFGPPERLARHPKKTEIVLRVPLKMAGGCDDPRGNDRAGGALGDKMQ